MKHVLASLALVVAARLPTCGQVVPPPEGPVVPPPLPSASAAAVPASPSANPVPVPPAIQAVLDAPDRTDADRTLDKGRHPGEIL